MVRRRGKKKPDDYTPQGDPAALAVPLEELKLDERAREILAAGGVRCAADLARLRRSQMFRIQNVNKRVCAEAEKALAALNLRFRPEEAPAEGASAQNARETAPRQERAPRDKNRRLRDGRERSADAPTQRGGRRDDPRAKNGKNARRGDRNDPFAGMSMNEILYGKRERPVSEPAEKPQLTPDSIVKFCRQGKWGYKDWKGNVLIQPEYDEAFSFSEGLACVEKEQKLGYIDRDNKLVIDYQFDSAGSFSEGLAVVTVGEKSGYIDPQGQFVIEPKYDIATSFHEGKAIVNLDKRWGVLDKDGSVFWR